MKKSVLIIFLLFTIFLASCSDETIYSHDYREEYGFIMGSMDRFVYDEYYFSMHKGNDIYYQNAENPIEGGMSVFEDPLSEADANNNPLNISSEIYMLVDPYSTERNNNVPVLIIAYNPLYDWDGVSIPEEHEYNRTTIVSYNMMNHKVTIIKENLPADLRNLSLYGNNLFYSCFDGDKGYDLYTMKLDGSDERKLNVDLDTVITPITADNDSLFFLDQSENKIYRYDLEADSYTVIADTWHPSGFVRDGYIYYYDDKFETIMHEGQPIITCATMRKKLNSEEPEEAYVAMGGAINYSDGITWKTGYGPCMYGGYAAYSDNKIYVYDWDTQTNELVADFSYLTEEVAGINCVCDSSAIIELTEYKDGTHTGNYKLVHIDLETKKSTVILLHYYDSITGENVYEYVVDYEY